jgi:hypothetical protein
MGLHGAAYFFSLEGNEMMKHLHRLLLAAVLAGAWSAPASAETLAKITVAGAVSNQVTAVTQVAEGAPQNLTAQATFVYGSGGTSADVWIQTSLDGGLTWIDIAQCHFLLASARKAYNLSSATAVTSIYTPGDGVLANDTSKDGVLGAWFRTKYTTTGTYAGGTTLTVDVVSSRGRFQ